MVLMIIKGLFRRYERWNPVHPTSGAFWGMGIGIGCGVGWGPGFGPEVIGYVGAGCGVGFSVGITLAGVGIGLPANFLVEYPYHAIMSTSSCALEVVRSSSSLATRSIKSDGWSHIRPQISGFKRDTSGSLFSFDPMHSFGQGTGLSWLKERIACHAKSMSKNLVAFRNQHLAIQRGSKD